MTSPDRVKQIIVSQKLDTLVAMSSDGARKLDMVTGSADDLCTAVDLMEASFQGPYKLEGYATTTATRQGRKTDADKPFVWIMAGIQQRQQSGAPSPAPAPVVKEVAVPDRDAIAKAAEARADARIAEAEVLRLEAENAQLRGQIKLLEEELEAQLDAEEQNATQMAAPRPWWEDGDQVEKKMDRLEGLVGRLFKKPAPAVLPAAGVTDEERELLAMARKWKATQPDQFQELTTQLKQHFGNESTQQQ